MSTSDEDGSLRIGHVELFVRDPLASRAFYEDVLGCTVVAVPHGRCVWLRLGRQEILLRTGTPPPRVTGYRASASGIVLYADDLAAARTALEARGLRFDGDDGPGCLTFTDPDGHWFQLVDPAHA